MQEIVEPLLTWYQENKRPLPWRQDRDFYHVWISEIMLQQTRIEAVKEYYARFMNDIPTVSALAAMSEDRMLKYWEGLGYYTRARNLKKAAMKIVEEYNGQFPDNYREILALPGIGEYTAGAIASICYSLPEVAIDGNVLRVMMRLLNSYDIIDHPATKKKVESLLKEIIPSNSGDFNQGIMELGEVICLPNALPRCELCPLAFACQSYAQKTMQELPVRKAKKEKKIEKRTILILRCQNRYAVEKREEKGLLHNLWQFPNIEGARSRQEIEHYLNDLSIGFTNLEMSISYRHIFTHIIWELSSYRLDIPEKLPGYHWCTLIELKEHYALPTAFEPIVKQLEKEEIYGV